MRALLVELRGYVVAGLRAADGPQARIEAIIDASFTDRQFQPQVDRHLARLLGPGAARCGPDAPAADLCPAG